MRQSHTSAKKLNECYLVEPANGLLAPIIVLEYDVAIQPGDLLALARYRFDGKVQQALLLPHHVSTRQLKQNLRIRRLEREPAAITQFHRHERNA